MKFIGLIEMHDGVDSYTKAIFIDAKDIEQAKGRAFRDTVELEKMGSGLPGSASSLWIYGLNGVEANYVECNDFNEALKSAAAGKLATEEQERAEYERLKKKFGE